MKTIIKIPVYLLFVSFCSTLSAQTQSIVTGHITGLPDNTKVWIISNTKYWKDSTISRNGNFQFILKDTNQGAYDIRLSRSLEQNTWKEFLIDKGELIIHAKNGLLKEVTVLGSPYAVDLNNYWQYQRSDKEFSYHISRINSMADARKLDSIKAIIALKWLKENPQSKIKAYLLYTIIKGHIPNEQLQIFINELSPELKQTVFANYLQMGINAPKITEIGQIAPDFVQADTSGIPVSIKQFRGKYVLIDFWASWCIPCREENPNLKKAYEKLKEKGLNILGVSLDWNKKNWIEAIHQDSLNWIHVSDLNFWDNYLVKLYGIHSVPANFLIDPEGKIIAKNLRGENLETELNKLIK